MADRLDKAISQVEFWFSDANLVRDKYLYNQLSSAKDGMVPVTLIAGFKKVIELAGHSAKPADVAALVVSAARRSTALKLSEDGVRIGRVAPLATAIAQNADDRTVYCESYPPDWNHDKLRELCETIAPVAYVSMPRYHNSRVQGLRVCRIQIRRGRACGMLFTGRLAAFCSGARR